MAATIVAAFERHGALGSAGGPDAEASPDPIGIDVRFKRDHDAIQKLATDFLVPEIVQALRTAPPYRGCDLSGLQRIAVVADERLGPPVYEVHSQTLILPVSRTQAKESKRILMDLRLGIWRVLRVEPLSVVDHLKPEFRRLIGEGAAADVEWIAAWRTAEWTPKLLERMEIQGRSIYLRLQKPVRIGNELYRAVRLKGVIAYECLPPQMIPRGSGKPGSYR